MSQLRKFNPFNVQYGKLYETEAELSYWRSLKNENPSIKQTDDVIKRTYKSRLELSWAAALAIVTVVFMAFRGVGTTSHQFEPPVISLAVEEIPVTEQIHRTPPPVRPSIPIPSEDADVPEDATIDDTEIDFAEVPPPPEQPQIDDDEDIFVVYDVAPEPIGGFAEIYKHIEYPPVAVKAELEGTVVVKCLVNTNGEVEKVEVIKDSGLQVGFEESAINALESSKWHPAKQRDRAVKVWVSVPIRFSLIQLQS